MIKLPLGPVMGLFQSRVRLFDVTLTRDVAGRPAPPQISADRYPSGIIQPANSRTLEWAAASGLLVTNGAYVLHTKAPVYVVDLMRGALLVDAHLTTVVTGKAPQGAASVVLTDVDGETIGTADVDPDTWRWSFTPDPEEPFAPGYVLNAQAFDGEDEPLSTSLRTAVGLAAMSVSGKQTYARHNGLLWKAWGLQNWAPHQTIARYILTQYHDTDGNIT